MLNVKSLARMLLGCGYYLLPSSRSKLSEGLTVFIFHEVTDCPSEFARKFNLNIPPRLFEKQLRWIRDNFRIIHPQELLLEKNDMRGAALITFDDGWAGAFSNGLPIMEKMDIPFLSFINARPIVEKRPLVASFATYLYLNAESFSSQVEGFSRTFDYLSLTPEKLMEIEAVLGDSFKDDVMAYQGSLIDMDTLVDLEAHPLVCIGNHLFDHWSCMVLDRDEFDFNYKRNETILAALSNYFPFFAFPYGQPDKAYSGAHIEWAKACGAAKVFSGRPLINTVDSSFELHRVSLLQDDAFIPQLWFRMGRAARGG